MPEEYRQDLHRRLRFVYQALSKTTFLNQILDQEWYDTISKEIEGADLRHPLQIDSALMFSELDHPFRGVQWFEEAQDLVMQGSVEQLDPDAKFLLACWGLDPLKTFLPILDERLDSFAKLPFKPAEVSRKLRELHANRFDPEFRNHVFELSVLGFFAMEGVLSDIEVPVGVGQGTVDGEISIDGRPILVEVTFTSQELLPPGPGVYFGDPKHLVNQVVLKIRRKVAEGRQLALARGIPSLLFVGRNHLGADEVASRWGVKTCFDDPDFAKLSGVVVSDTWKFLRTQFYLAPQPDTLLSEREIETLRRWFDT